MTNKIKRVALIGTGIMGAPIAGHVLDAGFDLTVHNRTPEKARALVERGAHWASSPAEAARDADVVLTMVGYPSDVEDVYLASDGIIRASRKGAYLIDLSTSAAELAREVLARARTDLFRQLRGVREIPVVGQRDGSRVRVARRRALGGR